MTIKSIFTALVLSAPLAVAFADEGQKKHDAFGISPSQPAGLRTIYACGNHHRSASLLAPEGQRDGGKYQLYVWDSTDNSELTLRARGSVAEEKKRADDFCAGGFNPAYKTILPARSMTWSR